MIGQAIRTCRKQRNLTQAELAKRARLSPEVMNRIENGKNNPSPESLDKIVKVLDVTVEQLKTDADVIATESNDAESQWAHLYTLGARLKTAREMFPFTLFEAATKCDIEPLRYAALERDEVAPTVDERAVIEKSLFIAQGYLDGQAKYPFTAEIRAKRQEAKRLDEKHREEERFALKFLDAGGRFPLTRDEFLTFKHDLADSDARRTRHILSTIQDSLWNQIAWAVNRLESSLHHEIARIEDAVQLLAERIDLLTSIPASDSAPSKPTNGTPESPKRPAKKARSAAASYSESHQRPGGVSAPATHADEDATPPQSERPRRAKRAKQP